MKIEGSVAVVTGGAHGIGKSIVTSLLKLGAKVCSVDVNNVDGEKTVEDLKQIHGDSVIFQKCDITKENEVRNALKVAKDTLGDVTIMVNNAGIMDEYNISGTIAINLEAPIRCTMNALEFMGRNNGGNGGVVVFTSSVAGITPVVGVPAYSAAKHGLVGFVRSMALSPRINDWGVRFNCVCPTAVDTPMLRTDYLRRGLHPDDVDSIMQIIDQNRKANTMLQPSEVADAMIKLIEDDTLNGASLLVTKGKTILVDPPAWTYKVLVI